MDLRSVSFCAKEAHFGWVVIENTLISTVRLPHGYHIMSTRYHVIFMSESFGCHVFGFSESFQNGGSAPSMAVITHCLVVIKIHSAHTG